ARLVERHGVKEADPRALIVGAPKLEPSQRDIDEASRDLRGARQAHLDRQSLGAPEQDRISHRRPPRRGQGQPIAARRQLDLRERCLAEPSNQNRGPPAVGVALVALEQDLRPRWRGRDLEMRGRIPPAHPRAAVVVDLEPLQELSELRAPPLALGEERAVVQEIGKRATHRAATAIERKRLLEPFVRARTPTLLLAPRPQRQRPGALSRLALAAVELSEGFTTKLLHPGIL